jgi:hypothetical protein
LNFDVVRQPALAGKMKKIFRESKAEGIFEMRGVLEN